ncbi:MAG: PilZ domain-containing protein [Acidobacteriia bacterium]|nr:PilZ domain-containing protein [Terriglobia bacterium]
MSMRVSAAPLTALLSSEDRAIQSLCGRLLESNGFNVTLAANAEMAARLCGNATFDLAIYDQDCSGVLELAGSRMPMRPPRIVIGLIGSGKMNEVTGKRIQFMVQKPFTSNILARTIRAACGPITWERRLNFRHHVSIATLSCKWTDQGETQPLQAATIVNISGTGLCLQTGEMLPQGAALEIRFPVPGGEIIQVSGNVIWSHLSGRAGICFTNIGPEQHFQAWLNSLLCEHASRWSDEKRGEHASIGVAHATRQ